MNQKQVITQSLQKQKRLSSQLSREKDIQKQMKISAEMIIERTELDLKLNQT